MSYSKGRTLFFSMPVHPSIYLSIHLSIYLEFLSFAETTLYLKSCYQIALALITSPVPLGLSSLDPHTQSTHIILWPYWHT